MNDRRLDALVDRTFEQFSLGSVLLDLRRRGIDVYLVGGAIRDFVAYPDREPADIDLMTSAPLETLMPAFALHGTPRTNRHGNLRFFVGGGRHVDVIHTSQFYGNETTVERALPYFDTSVNALALSIHRGVPLLDPLGGWRDLIEGRARLPEARWASSDALEDVHVLLRALRLVERMGLRIANPDVAIAHRLRFDEVDWDDLERLNGFGRAEAEAKYARVFQQATLPLPALVGL